MLPMKSLRVLLLLLFLLGYSAAVRAQNLPEQECNGAIPVCQSTYTQLNSYSGFGLIQELNATNQGCLQSGERNDVWYVINVSTSGGLIFSIAPNGQSDYDFAVWNITGGGCQMLYNGLQPVRCDFAGGVGATGLAFNPPGFGWQPAINANAGETYLLNVSNFNTNQTGYLLSFAGSTASIFDNLPPHFVSASTQACGANSDTVKVLMSEPILCGSLAVNGSDFSLTPAVPGVSIVSASAPNCTSGGTASLNLNIRLSAPLPNGTYTLKAKNGTDGNTLFDNCSNAQPVGDSVTFTIGSPPPPVYTLLRPAQCSRPALFSITPPVAGIYTLDIKQGTTTLRTFSNVSGAQVDSLFSGNYTATLTSAGCSSTVAFTIAPQAPPPTLSFAITPTCTGGAKGAVTVTPSSTSGSSGTWNYSWNTTPARSGQTITGLSAGIYTVTATNSLGCTVTGTAIVGSVPGFTLNLTQTPVSCNGRANGTATVTATGGTAPYSYGWNTAPTQNTATATGLISGNYTVFVTDSSGCTVNGSVAVTQPTAVAATVTTTAASCAAAANGTATATVAGGTAPYTYLWSNGQTTQTATGFSAGMSHDVLVQDAKGCADTVLFSIPAGNGINGSFTQIVSPTCYGQANGSVRFSPTGGAAPYTYAWSNGQTTQTATGLAAGTYTVTTTDAAGCTRNDTLTLAQPAALQTLVTADSVSCFGGNNGKATATVSGGTAPYAYQWNTTPVKTTATATGLISGNYRVVVTDAKGCRDTANTVVQQPAALSVATGVQRASCPGIINGSAYAAVSGGTAPYTYRWNTTPIQTTDTATGLLPRAYTVTVTDAKGCTLSQAVAVPGFTLQTTQTNASCNGIADGSATVISAGGIPPYTYSWNSAPVQTTATATGLPAGTYIASVTDSNGCTISANAVITQPTPLAATFTTVPASCGAATNGRATVSVSGSKGSYTYLWNTTPAQTTATATGLSGGSYQVVVTDAGNCTATFSVTVPTGGGISGNFTRKTQPACFGLANGSLVFTPTGGAAPYTYAWSNGQATQTATGLVSGNYSVTVTDANGCMRTDTTTLGEPALLQVNTQGDSVLCFGGASGKATATVTGGTAPYNYSWNTAPVQTTRTATGLISGNYRVTVTDAKGCTQTANVTIEQPTAITATTGVKRAYCAGSRNGSAYVAASGGAAPYSYSWNTTPIQTGDTATGLFPGPYTVTITDAKGCAITRTVTVPGFQINTTQTDLLCNGATNGQAAVTATDGIAPYSYAWSTGQTTPAINGLRAGSYTIAVTGADGCTLTRTVVIAQPAALAATVATTDAACAAAANGTATVNVTGGVAPYTYRWNTTPVQTTSAVSGLRGGVYSVVVKDANNCSATLSVGIGTGAGVSGTFSQIVLPACFGNANGSVVFTPSGGIAPYTYNWSNGQTSATATGLTAGTYTIAGADNVGCTFRDTITLTQPAALTATATGADVSCFGGNNGTATVTAGGGTMPYSYSWNTTPTKTTATLTRLISGNYTATITDAKGCTQSATVIINEPAALVLAAVKTNISCNGGTNGTASVVVSGGTAPYTYLWNTTPAQTTAAIANLPAGTYRVTVTDAHNCVKTVAVTLTQPALPLALTTAQTMISCNGNNNGTATITATGGTAPYTYAWSNGRTTAAITGLAPGTYTVNVTDANGCAQTAAFTITQPTALALATTQTDVRCFGGNTGTATVTPTGGITPYSYQWNTTPTQTTATARGLISGNYTATVIDAKGCTQTTTVVINQPPALTATATGTNVSCNGGTNGTATVTAGGGVAPYTYSWNTTPVQTMPFISALAARNYQATVKDANNCTQTATVVISQPAAALTLKTTITNVSCNGGNNGTATVTATGGTAPYTYSWDNGQTTATATGLISGNYTVTTTDANGCTQTATVNITQPTALTATNTQTDVFCFGGNNGMATVTATGGTAPYSYSWNTMPVQTTATIRNLISGNYTATITDAKGCTTTQAVVIRQPTALTMATGTQNAICAGIANGKAYAIASGGTAPYAYLWNTVPAQTTDTAFGLRAGMYSVTITDAKGCRATQTVAVLASPGVVAAIHIDRAPCTGAATGELSGTATGGTAPYAYSWNTAPAQTTASIQNLAAGTYRLIVTDSNRCADTAFATLQYLPLPTVSAGADKILCAGQSVALNGSGTAATWKWTPAAGLSCDTCLKPVTNTLTDRFYTLTGTGANGCQNKDSVRVQVTQRDTISVGKLQQICEGTTTRLQATGGTQYLWSPAATLSNSASATPTARPDTTTRYRVIITQGSCFKDTLYQKVEVYKQPVITLPRDLSALYGTKVRLPAQVQNASRLEWTPFDNLDCDTCLTPVATVSGTVTYVLTAANAGGCSATDSVTIHTDCDLKNYFFPTAFAPEGADEVRWFYPKSKDPGTVRSMKIFNRWGKVVFDRSNFSLNTPHLGWNGYHNGQLSPQGVYVYVIETLCTGGQTLTVSGTVTLLQ